MAVDTRDRRFSMLAFGLHMPYVLPDPDNTLGTSDRAHLTYLYPGIALNLIGQAGSEHQFFFRRRRAAV